MNHSNHFVKEIPSDYVLIKHVDAKSDKKQITIYTILSFVPIIILMPLLLLIYFKSNPDVNLLVELEPWELIVFILVIISYLVLHEITHGITYKLFTGEKLKFGLTLTVAFCGVPNIYVRKKASFASLVMPFIVFTIIFVALTVGFWFTNQVFSILMGLVLSIHIGGCVGDFHWALLYLTKFRGIDTLMRDTGPEQWLYIPSEKAIEKGFKILE